LVIFHIYAFRNLGELLTVDESQIDWHVLAPFFPLQPNEEIIVVQLLVAIAMVCTVACSLSFHLTCQSSVVCKLEAKLNCKTRNTFRGARVLYVCSFFNQWSLLYQCKHIRRCGLVVASVQNDQSIKDDGLESFHWTKIFIPNSKKIDRKYANVWLEDVPNLSVES